MSTISLYLLALCQAVIGLVFGISSITKLRDRSAFRGSIRQMVRLPAWAETPVIWGCILTMLLSVGANILGFSQG